jgi:hypothetical protein
MAKDLDTKLEAKKAETIAQIKGQMGPFFPQGLRGLTPPDPKLVAFEKALRESALSAVYQWIVAPDGENSQKCLEIGNQCTQHPEGLLALSAFWAFGNMGPPDLAQVIPTPAGLAANGIDKTLLMCALADGGTRKLEERYERYFNLGVEVLSGKDNWGESLADSKAPHEKIRPAPHTGAIPTLTGPGPMVYKRWKPV